ncbi:hypothetical protein Pan44_10240 [Caulifigura coniformis]|uniref:Uncharacterized protein n=1 Tax=Caulifigura coniformis TaxID=2527983 RepID=A0A517SA49_9PLAN|nr:hypothetical protein [Caulifigura coniformis]QDT53009.1 hypothetical protein Pan44_10240 [Caulifigura coniformis]
MISVRKFIVICVSVVSHPAALVGRGARIRAGHERWLNEHLDDRDSINDANDLLKRRSTLSKEQQAEKLRIALGVRESN